MKKGSTFVNQDSNGIPFGGPIGPSAVLGGNNRAMSGLWKAVIKKTTKKKEKKNDQ